jgi:hypothetical protein
MRLSYAPPEVADLGDVGEMTRGVHLLLGQAGMSDLSFSSPVSGGGGNGFAADPTHGGVGGETATGGNTPGAGGGGGGGADPGGSGAGAGAGAGGAGGGGGGKLPFTGFAAGAAAAIGSGMVAAGTALRRAARRRRAGAR